MLKSVVLSMCLVSVNAATASVLHCQLEKRCSSLTAECGNEPLNLRADFASGEITVLDNGNVFKAEVVEDQAMPFRTLTVTDGRGAISMLSVHDDLSAVYTYHTGLVPVGAIWSSSSGMCREKS